MGETLQGWAIGLAVLGVVAAFIRFCPKIKLLSWLCPKCRAAGVVTSAFLIVRLGKRAAQRVEEGIIVTVGTVISDCIGSFIDGLLADNQTRKGKRK